VSVREITENIPELVFAGQDPPAQAIAGTNNASFDYSSGRMLAEYHHGAGRFILNTLPIREQLPTDPVAERLLRNLLRHAAREASQSVAPVPGSIPVAEFVRIRGGVGTRGVASGLT
jgi:hypothetical protein